MMKYSLLLFFTFLSLCGFTQQKQFTLDERGKYVYYEVVGTKINRDSLVLRAENFIKLNKKSFIKSILTDSSITSEGKMIVDKTILVASHPSGEVNYTFNFEARNDKYRYWITDLEYIPYNRDRYGNYVPTTTIATPLEKTPGKLSAGAWKDIVESVYVKAEKLGENFKKVLATSQVKTLIKKTESISTKKW
ncbi:hypothetical protein QWY86_08815 [Pedobacter aquatilis]|uniref:hypothetical protein n=1 Tax=Pedobacter aquatilis TaxID=351343 RepID=UPI0025B311E0|nr:hypothetical protein [Pedobacter aquatilis]MDN3586765.1 hypothetical protein [Pedobacter aquatilis]